MRTVVIALGIVGIALELGSTWAGAAEPTVGQVLAASELDPLRKPERVESWSVDVAVLSDALPVREDVGQQLAGLLLATDSYVPIPRALRCAFEPEIALRFRQGTAAVDVLVCFECSQLVFERVGARRTPRRLAFGPVERELFDLVLRARPGDARLTAVQAKWRERGRVAREVRTRWVDAMPVSLRPFWREPKGQVLTFVPQSGKEYAQVKFLDAEIGPMQLALAKAVPEPSARIRALLRWYGSGAGPWTGYPSYEVTATRLLLAHPTRDLVAAAQAAPLSLEQTEGAARLFASWEFLRERPKDGKLIPADLRKRLLEHGAASADEDKRTRAKTAFGAGK